MIGAVFGRSIGGTFDAPSRPKPVAREIPSVAWFRTPVVHCVIGGFLPFRFCLQISVFLSFPVFMQLYHVCTNILLAIICLIMLDLCNMDISMSHS